MLISQQSPTFRYKDLLKKNKKKGKEKFFSYLPRKKEVFWMGSAREGIKISLQASKNRLKKEKLRVGVPAYTCHVVPSAAKRAGAEVIFYESDIVAEVEDIKKIIKTIDVLILSYNFGFLPDIEKITTLCKKNKVLLIEDCAQAFGASYKEKPVGSFGDMAVYSFGISKNISAAGGLVLSNIPLETEETQKIRKKKGQKPYPRLLWWKKKTELLLSPFLFHKAIYPITYQLLKRQLKKPSNDALSFSFPKAAKSILYQQALRYERIRRRRERNAKYLQRELKGLYNFEEEMHGKASWLYFIIKTRDQEEKEQLKISLLKEGLHIGEMFSFHSFDKKFKKARKAQETILTFALYRKTKECKKIVATLKKVAKEKKDKESRETALKTSERMKNLHLGITLMVVCTLFTSVGQLFYKMGANNFAFSIEGILLNIPFILGLTFYGIGAILLIIALKYGELSVLFPFVSLSFVWVALLSALFLGEQITELKLLAVIAIITGIVLIGRGAEK